MFNKQNQDRRCFMLLQGLCMMGKPSRYSIPIVLKYLICLSFQKHPEAEFKELEPRLKFETWLKWLFHIKLYSMFQDFSRRSVETSFWRI